MINEILFKAHPLTGHSDTKDLHEMNNHVLIDGKAYLLLPFPSMEDKETDREFILCSANHYDDGIEHSYSPKNIKTGFVVCGHRHHNCIGTFAQMVGFPYSDEAHKLQNTEEQGFLTNTNRFVDRKEACRIAILANQISDTQKETLYSEDLY